MNSSRTAKSCKQKHGVIDTTQAYPLPGAERCLGSWRSVPGAFVGYLLTVQWWNSRVPRVERLTALQCLEVASPGLSSSVTSASAAVPPWSRRARDFLPSKCFFSALAGLSYRKKNPLPCCQTCLGLCAHISFLCPQLLQNRYCASLRMEDRRRGRTQTSTSLMGGHGTEKER